MKDLTSCRLMRWLTDRGLPAHRAYDALSWMGFCSFMLTVLISICMDNLELSGWMEILAPAALAAMGLLLIFSGYCLWQTNVLWVMLLLFGAGDVVLGLAIDLGDAWRVIFCGLGLYLLALGGLLAGRQLRNAKALKPLLEQSRTDWQLQRQKKAAGKRAAAKAVATADEVQPVQPMPQPAHPAVPAVNAAEQPQPPLGLPEQPVLWSLACCMPDADPIYLGTGCAEVFTDGTLASVRRDSLSGSLGIQTGIRRYGTPEDIRAFLTGCVHNGISTLRINCGSPAMREIPLRDVLDSREAHLIDEKNRPLRYQLLRAKQSAWSLSRQPDKKSLHARKIAETMLTARLNGYRALGNSLLYVLVSGMPLEDLCATRAALDQLAAWAPGSGYEEDAALQAPVITVPLRLGFANHPGSVGDAGKGCLCVYTDLAQARKGQSIFRENGMNFAVGMVTYEEMAGQATQCAGILVDMGTISLEIPKADYGQVEVVRKLDGPIVARINAEEKPAESPAEAASPEAQPAPAQDKAGTQPRPDAAQPGPTRMHTAMAGPWKQFDYRWPHRFGYDFMLRSAQWLMDHGMTAKTLTTAAITGAPETEHIQQLQEGLSLKECAGHEAGVLSLGGFDESVHGILKICWFNQTDLVRVFIMSEADQAAADGFIDRLWEAERKDFA